VRQPVSARTTFSNRQHQTPMALASWRSSMPAVDSMANSNASAVTGALVASAQWEISGGPAANGALCRLILHQDKSLADAAYGLWLLLRRTACCGVATGRRPGRRNSEVDKPFRFLASWVHIAQTCLCHTARGKSVAATASTAAGWRNQQRLWWPRSDLAAWLRGVLPAATPGLWRYLWRQARNKLVAPAQTIGSKPFCGGSKAVRHGLSAAVSSVRGVLRSAEHACAWIQPGGHGMQTGTGQTWHEQRTTTAWFHETVLRLSRRHRLAVRHAPWACGMVSNQAAHCVRRLSAAASKESSDNGANGHVSRFRAFPQQKTTVSALKQVSFAVGWAVYDQPGFLPGHHGAFASLSGFGLVTIWFTVPFSAFCVTTYGLRASRTR